MEGYRLVKTSGYRDLPRQMTTEQRYPDVVGRIPLPAPPPHLRRRQIKREVKPYE